MSSILQVGENSIFPQYGTDNFIFMETSRSYKEFRSRSVSNAKRINVHITANTTTKTSFRPACSLAEFNRIRHAKKPKRQILQVGEPVRIAIPSFFNVPKHQQLPANHPTCSRNLEQSNVYLTTVHPQDNPQTVSCVTLKKINDLKVISVAMRRHKNLKQESRTHYCTAVLYDNIGNYRLAIEHYQKFLRIALFLQDRCSIELVINSIGIAYMNLFQFSTAYDYHIKQIQLGEKDKTRFIGRVNAGMCKQKMGEFNQAFEEYEKALTLCEQSTQRKKFVKELVTSLSLRLSKQEELFDRIQKFLKSVEQDDRNMVTSFVRLGGVEAANHDYNRSRMMYAKALEFGYLNEEPKKIALNKKLMKQAQIGYAISSAQNKMQIFLKTYSQNISKYKI